MNDAENLALKQECELSPVIPLHPFNHGTVYIYANVLFNNVAVLLDVHN